MQFAMEEPPTVPVPPPSDRCAHLVARRALLADELRGRIRELAEVDRLLTEEDK